MDHSRKRKIKSEKVTRSSNTFVFTVAWIRVQESRGESLLQYVRNREIIFEVEEIDEKVITLEK